MLASTCISRANTILVPVMASRLMLSLKKASIEPKGVWSLETMANATSRELAGDGTICFATRVSGRSHEILQTSATTDGEGVALSSSP